MDEQISGLPVAVDLAESDGSGAIAVGLLDATGERGGLTSSLDGELLLGNFVSSGFASGLFGTSHFDGGCLFLLLKC